MRRRRGLIVLCCALSVFALAVLGLWLARKPIARNWIDHELARRSVPAHYELTALGPRWQRLDHIRIGNPDAPDLVADRIEVRLSTGLRGVTVSEIRASGVRAKARYTPGRLSFGSLDRLLPASRGGPFAWPALLLRLKDARLTLTLPEGIVNLGLTGRGALPDGFRGELSAASQRLDVAGCTLAGIGALEDLQISLGTPRLTGKATASSIRCGANGASGISADNRIAVGNKLDRWSARTAFRAGHITLDPRWRASLTAVAGSLHRTPLAPLGRRLAVSVDRLLSTARVDGRVETDGTTTRFATLQISSATGESLKLLGAPFATFTPGGVAMNGTGDLSGPGLPTARVLVNRSPDGQLRALLTAEPYLADSTRLALAPIRIVGDRSGRMRVETEAEFDGVFAGGSVRGLRFPVRVQSDAFGLRIGDGCTPVAFHSLAASGMVLDPARLVVCPTGLALVRIERGRVSGGARLQATRLKGRLGSTPLNIVADGGRISLAGQKFVMQGLKVGIGAPGRASTLSVGSVDGAMIGADVTGRFAQLSGAIARVPLDMSQASGRWRLAGGKLSVDTDEFTVADQNVPARFNPLEGRAAHLALAAGVVQANATLHEPHSQHLVMRLTLSHNLSNGSGLARLQVPDLVFGPALQPEAMTPLTLGVVANVHGRVTGEGRIAWDRDGVHSMGRFATDGLDFAAAFGPVAGLKGTINFTDLLGLVTAPSQEVTIAQVNPGLPVADGHISYRLLPGQRVAVEGGRWPFAGGQLSLEPTMLDMGRSSSRNLTFRIVGLDAAKFIQQLEFENLAATGIFDGLLPMVFDASGGRITGGHLVARPGGGTLAYVGDVSNARMNMFAKLAFDALKSMRYDNLVIDMNGPLDGEIVSRVSFAGVNQSPVVRPKGFIARQLTGLPFRFNIVIKAPFRGLLATARTFQQPQLLLNRSVQPPESTIKP